MAPPLRLLAWAATLSTARGAFELLAPKTSSARTLSQVFSDEEDHFNASLSRLPKSYSAKTSLWAPVKEVLRNESGAFGRVKRAAMGAVPVRARCKNNRPILSELFCDGKDDCGDGSDELDCSFECEDGTRKMPRTWQCDGDKDCLDSSDEKCFKCNNGALIPKEWRCDGERDCPGSGGEDELCFLCGNGKRLVPHFVCDGDNDCGDASDEAFCFACASGRSVSATWRCDGADDCGDGSDEADCHLPLPTPSVRPRLRLPRQPPPRAFRRRRPLRPKVVLSRNMRSYILKWHNRHRLRLANGTVRGQPPAANMKLLRWDPDIAAKSQQWALECDYSHETNKHCKTGGFHSLGENIAVSTINYPGTHATDRDLYAMVRHALQSMWKEHAHFTYGPSPGKCAKEPCGHYTQMVWAETEALGCALTSCKSIKNWIPGRRRNTLFLVCKYGPAGNINGVLPYNSGKGCSGCGSLEGVCRGGGLCAKRKGAGEGKCRDSPTSCKAMKAKGAKGRYKCWPCEKWARDGTCDVCANTFRHAREVCADTCGLCDFQYTLNNRQA